MMSCFTYMKKNDDMNRLSSSIVDHEYNIKYPILPWTTAVLGSVMVL